MSLMSAHHTSNMKKVEDIIAKSRDKSYALVSGYEDQYIIMK